MNRKSDQPMIVRGCLGLAMFCLAWSTGCGGPVDRAGTVVVYASQDQVYAERILRDFTRETGIEVKAVYDSEAVKTVGLANRLLAERAHPQCDLFWSNEALRTHQLAAKGLFREENGWAAFGYRSRRLVAHTNLVAAGGGPAGLMDLTNTIWKGRVALAYPLFGTTAAHVVALRRHWGEPQWRGWCAGLMANEPMLLDGNSVVVRMVGGGAAAVGLTDHDDIVAGQRAGLPIAALPLSPEMLLIPNTVGVVRGSPNPAGAQKLFDYLQRPGVVRALVEMGALEGTGSDGPAGGTGTLAVRWEELVEELDPAMQTVKAVFLK